MHVYVFSSKNMTNIWAGIGARLWAVSEAQGCNESIRTKAKKLPVGSLGLLYCVDTQSVTTPFLITSKPDGEANVTNVWPERWTLPFSIFPLGSPRLQVHKDNLGALLPSLRGSNQWDQLLHIQPTTVFAPWQIADEDWSALVSELVDR
jgi:hypothetical protein